MAADLQSRIGKKKLFPNQSWTKPGYEPPKRSFPKRLSSEDHWHECEAESSFRASRRVNSPMRGYPAPCGISTSRHASSPAKPPASLLERIQMEPDGGGDVDMDRRDENKQTKSLLDRVENPLDELPATPAPPPAGVDELAIKNNLDGDSGTDSAPTILQRLAPIGQAACSASGSPVNDNHGQFKGQRNIHGADPTEERSHHHLRSLSIAVTPPSRSSSISKADNTPTSGRGDLHRPSIQRIDSDSASSITAEEFLNHILPLTERIALSRAGDPEAGNAMNTAEIASSVVTDEVIADFNKMWLNLRNDLDDLKLYERTIVEDSRNEEKKISQDKVLVNIRSPLSESRPAQPLLQAEIPPEVKSISTNNEIPILPLPTRVTKTNSISATPASAYKRKYPYSESRYPNQNSYPPEQRRTARNNQVHDGAYRHSSRGRAPPRWSISPYRRSRTSSKQTTKESRTQMDYSPRYQRSRSRSRGRLRGWSPSPSPEHPSERERHRGADHAYSDHDAGRPVADSVSSISGKNFTEYDNLEVAGPFATRTEPFLPCHNVPGLWFGQQGLHQLGISTVEFEIDELAAKKWEISSDGTIGSSTSNSDATPAIKLSLELCCLAFHDFQITAQRLGKNVTSHELVQELFALKKAWPPQGTLIVVINPESKNGRVCLPNMLTESPLQIEKYVQKGCNIVKFIQLSSLSEHIFLLIATAMDNSSHLKFLFPEQGTGIKFQAPNLSINR